MPDESSPAAGDAGPVIAHLPQTAPADSANRELVRHVHPPDWINPQPGGRYHLVVLGAGTAGLVAAAAAAGLGARVALIERDLMGGDCLNVGCVPSKSLLAAARAVRAVRRAGEFGVRVPGGVTVDFPAVMARMRAQRAGISPHDAAARFRDLGVDVYFGAARFRDGSHVEVQGQVLAFRRAVIATGARSAVPAITGLDQVPYLTNETLFSLTELPPRLAVIGAGPIGCEMAQALAAFGSEVVLIEAAHGVLPREERDAAACVQRALEAEGVRVLCCGRQLQVRAAASGAELAVESHGQAWRQSVDAVLVAAGRLPNVEQLNLEAAGVQFAPGRGVVVDDRLRSTNPRVFAAGDVCSEQRFTHAADFMARLVVRNALFPGRGKLSRLTIPWCTYTSPELARVGLSPDDARGRGIETDTFQLPFSQVDRAVLDGQTDGLVKVHVRRGTDRIVGGTIVGEQAGDLIAELALAMTCGLGLKQIGGTIHPYPTRSEAIRRLGDLYHRSRLTPRVMAVLKAWFAWTG